ncbi:DUF4367 domain-containing protein [Paenibacillus hamazuiensis]|uniref:DUF4367 domain-containing protein n=1 Tax=Paenibacillus hamazuiensis TaxID=2936508 RepID=UPI00200FC07E|nr:DUF4367 domain-containing protein [Paenibacillus hamazuiensis]
MDKGWLLLFKSDVISQSPAVQRALFGQFVRVAAGVKQLAALEPVCRRRALVSAFLKAASAGYEGKDAEQIELSLKRLTERAAARQSGVRPAGQENGTEKGPEPEVAADPSYAATSLMPDETELLSAWEELADKLHAKRRLRKWLRQTGTVAMMTVTVVAGGLLFGFAAPWPERMAVSSDDTASPSPAQAGETAGVLKSVNVTESGIRQFTDFPIVIPAYLPQGYRSDEAVVWLRDGDSKSEHAMLVYTNEEGYLLRISFYKLPKNGNISSSMFRPSSQEELFLRGSKAILTTTGDGFFKLDWVENETYISLSGRLLSKDEVIKMAESLK